MEHQTVLLSVLEIIEVTILIWGFRKFYGELKAIREVLQKQKGVQS
jgi:hypothetical protein